MARINYDKIEIAVVFAKARVASMKPLTIPKEELQAATLAARLKGKFQLALTRPIERTFMWTDSTEILRSVDRKITSLCSNPSGGNSRVDNRRMELRSNS